MPSAKKVALLAFVVLATAKVVSRIWSHIVDVLKPLVPNRIFSAHEKLIDGQQKASHLQCTYLDSTLLSKGCNDPSCTDCQEHTPVSPISLYYDYIPHSLNALINFSLPGRPLPLEVNGSRSLKKRMAAERHSKVQRVVKWRARHPERASEASKQYRQRVIQRLQASTLTTTLLRRRYFADTRRRRLWKPEQLVKPLPAKEIDPVDILGSQGGIHDGLDVSDVAP